MLTQEKRSITLELKNAGVCSPAELMTFSKEYTEHIILLKNYIAKNINKNINLLIARMNTDGELGEMMEFSGLAKELNGNLITIESAKDPVTRILSDELHNYVIRTDNVLGVLPFLPSGRDINPFISAENESSLTFLDFLTRSRNLLKTCLGQTHHVELIFETKINGKKGEEIFECEIQKVNKSNVEINQIKKGLYINGGSSITVGSFDNIVPFRTDTKFLKKITIYYGSKLKVDPYDDGEEF